MHFYMGHVVVTAFDPASWLAGSLGLDDVRLKRYSIAEVHAHLKISKRLEQSKTKSLCLFSFSIYFLELNSFEKVVFSDDLER